ncbi:phosphopantothenoylcysteine synthetase/decarboxylase family protein [Lacunimicrobium album]
MRILITAGPTREYLDDVRYLTNASSGRMGYAMAQAAIAAGHQVDLVSGPVALSPPVGCQFHPVETTEQMMQACQTLFPQCDGVIAAAAVCDYKPKTRVAGKMSKTGDGIILEMIQTDDVLASLGGSKGSRWVLGFALEAQNERENALQKLRRKNCDWILLNRPTAIGAETNEVELLGQTGETIVSWSGLKSEIAKDVIGWISSNLPT